MSSRDVAGMLPPALLDPPGGPGESGPALMRAFMAAVSGQYDQLAADVDQLWQDLFIESCDAWAVPYIAELLGLPADAERLEVAYAIALRRRKGTPAALEDFAYVVTGLTARVVEGWQVTTWAQRLGHPPPPRAASFALSGTGVFRLGTPFERARRAFTPSGRWSPRAATAIVWPWQVRTLVDTQAAPLPEARRYALHPQGADAPPYLLPRPARLATGEGHDAATRTGDEADAPVRATYRVLQALAGPGEITHAGSLKVAASHPLADRAGAATPPLLRVRVGPGDPVPWDKLRFGALPRGAAAPFPPASDEVLVDLTRGHIELGAGLSGVPRVTWHRPVAGLLGALASAADADARARVAVTVNPQAGGVGGIAATLDEAFARARQLAAALDPALSRPGVPDVEIRLATSDRLAAPAAQEFTATVPNWRIVAPPLTTPTVVGTLRLDLGGACVELAGFRLAGDLELGAHLTGVALEGLTMDPGAGSVLVDPNAWELAFAARRSVLGPVRADLGALPLEFTDCVVDGRRDRLRACAGDPPGPAAAPADAVAAASRFGPAIVADACTFSGPVRVDAASARDTVFADGVDVVQQQDGCLRNCHLGPELTTPARHPTTYHCDTGQPPRFVSTGFEAAGYYCLALDPEQPLLSAAGDGGEVGAYHRARRGARIRRLRRRVEEFVPLGLRARVEVADWEEG
ncbi:phage tail protein [Yinghuangia seranimata]|uniref:phage tail protein n=1 Tax=Yinghuangia seranimata TaxID=408067 RepID=UPI00248A9C50|nr:phage tail protein [Yinghuangia seranimata]MDI2131682.1 phage tail protein [Yinghuangia seranimata]